MKKHEDFIALAIKCAKEAVDAGEFPFGAVVVKNGEVVGRSHKDPVYDCTAHAEVTAIRSACFTLKTNDLTGCIIYSSCHPCQMCLGAIKWSGIKEMYYAMDSSDAAKIGYKNDIFFDETIKITGHKISDEPLLTFMKQWYDKK